MDNQKLFEALVAVDLNSFHRWQIRVNQSVLDMWLEHWAPRIDLRPLVAAINQDLPVLDMGFDHPANGTHLQWWDICGSDVELILHYPYPYVSRAKERAQRAVELAKDRSLWTDVRTDAYRKPAVLETQVVSNRSGEYIHFLCDGRGAWNW